MPGATVRIKQETQAVLRELASETEKPMQDLLAEAVEAYRRDRILQLTNAAYAALRADPKAWAKEQEERSAWDATLADDQEDD
jgi:hypothetical protein